MIDAGVCGESLGLGPPYWMASLLPRLENDLSINILPHHGAMLQDRRHPAPPQGPPSQSNYAGLHIHRLILFP